MNFSKIIREAYQITIKHKFLWLLGLLVGGTSFGSNLYNYSSNPGDFQKIKELFDQPIENQSVLKFFTEVAHAAPPSGGISSSGLAIIGVISVLLVLLFIYLSITAKGAIIWSVADFAQSKESNLKKAWGLGHKFFWRRISYAIIVFFIIVISLFVLALPAIIFGIAQLTIPAIIFGILALLVFVVGVVYLSLILPIAERALFLHQLRPVKALKEGYHVFNSNWGNFLILYLIIFGFGLLFALATLVAMLIPGLIIFLIGYLIYLFSHIAAYIVGGILAFLVIVALIIFNGAFQALISSVLTLGFLEKQKIT